MEDRFLSDIASMPFDPAPRLLYADWLEEHGDSRAEFLRLSPDAEPKAICAAAKIEWQDDVSLAIKTCGLPKNLFPLFAADCAERVLSIFEERYPTDDRPRKAIEAARSREPNPMRAFEASEAVRAAEAEPVEARAEARAALAAAEAALAAAKGKVGEVEAGVGRSALAAARSAEESAGRSALAAEMWSARKAAKAAEVRWQFFRLGEYKLWGNPICSLPGDSLKCQL